MRIPPDIDPRRRSGHGQPPVTRATTTVDDFQEAIRIAATLYNDIELAFWLNAPQPLIDMFTPIQLLACGRTAELLQRLRQLEDGVYI